MPRPVTSKSRGICRYYNTSRGCFAGDNCKFRHGEHEKLTPYDKSKTCRYFAAGTCSRFITPKFANHTPLGYCKRGEGCWFRHVPPSSPPADSAESLICAICMEEPITFGLLGWRSVHSSRTKLISPAPQLTVATYSASTYATYSVFFVVVPLALIRFLTVHSELARAGQRIRGCFSFPCA
jgi:hypothetical protein